MFKKATKEAILPTKGTKYSACVDVYANEDVVIGAGEMKLIGLGITIDLDNLLENVPMVKDMRRWHKKRFKAGIIDVSEEDGLRHVKDEFLKSHYLQLMISDSLATKGLMLNNIKIFNLDYKDEIKMIIHNPLIGSIDSTSFGCNGKIDFKIKKGDCIGQLILLEHKSYLFGIESETK